MIWKGFLLTLSWLGIGLTWLVGKGLAVQIGIDSIVGLGSPFSLTQDLREYLEDFSIYSLDQARNLTSCAQSYWFTAEELDLVGNWKHQWDAYTVGLEFGRIRLTEQCDTLLWSHDKYIGALSAAQGYDRIASTCCISRQSPVLSLLWKLNIPLKICCFILLLMKDRVLTWDQLQRRGRQGPSLCLLCRNGEDTSQHLFMDCKFSRSVYSVVGEGYGLPSTSNISVSYFLE